MGSLVLPHSFNADGLPLAAAATHYGWLSRQYQTAAEMVSGSRIDAAVLAVSRPTHIQAHTLLHSDCNVVTCTGLGHVMVACHRTASIA
jgi:predicted dehydrogenase